MYLKMRTWGLSYGWDGDRRHRLLTVSWGLNPKRGYGQRMFLRNVTITLSLARLFLWYQVSIGRELRLPGEPEARMLVFAFPCALQLFGRWRLQWWPLPWRRT